MQQLSVQRITFVGFGLAAALVLALAGIAWAFTQQTLQAAAFVSQTHAVMSAIGEAETALYRAEASHRSYVIARQAGFAERLSAYVAERDAAIGDLRARLGEVQRMTPDNRSQQLRVQELLSAIEDRVEVYRGTEAHFDAGNGTLSEERQSQGRRVMAQIRPLFADLEAEEERLLNQRQSAERRRTDNVSWAFGALVLLLVLMLPAIFWRIRRDMRAREVAEAATSEERRYDQLHTRALMLYNAENRQQAALDGTLALLDEGGLFPAAAIYLHEELGGSLRLSAARGASADAKPVLRLGEGPLGTAALSGKTVHLEAFDPTDGLRIETGLAVLRPAAMLFCPVSHQGRLLGVLALAAARRLSGRDVQFVERLCFQFGVALHNLIQLEGLNELARELRERSADIESKNQQLERATRMKSEFVANMSHELRTPLNAVIGFSEILRDGLAGELTPEQTEYMADIHGSGKHLLSLINDILDLSKVEAGQMALDLAPAEPSELAASGLAVVREKAALRRIEVSDVCPPGLGRLQMDVRKAKQIVFNLLSNAVKFTPEGGRVSLALARVPRAAIEAAREAADTRVFPPRDLAPAHWLEIRVRDSGIGIAPEGLRELFQPFVQIDSSLTRKFEGTGLGLTMVQRLTELHGGGMQVLSTPQQGSAFVVWLPWREVEPPDDDDGLPLLDQEVASRPVLPAAGPAPLNGADIGTEAPLVLVIEDDPRAASLLRLQLQAHGYRVEAVLNAESGLQRAAELQPQAIVLDIILPGMDGWDMLARLKERAATRRIPVVIVSITDEPRRGFALGAAQVLVKPVAQEDLLGALAAMGLEPAPVGGRVLVVDDDPKAVTMVCKHLQLAGFAPLAAYGGQEALDLVRHQRPELIVLDLMMPNVSGFDVVEALARDPGTAGIPVLVLTARLVDARDRELLRGRVQRILEKAEFQASSLLAEVQRALAKRQRTQVAGHAGPH